MDQSPTTPADRPAVPPRIGFELSADTGNPNWVPIVSGHRQPNWVRIVRDGLQPELGSNCRGKPATPNWVRIAREQSTPNSIPVNPRASLPHNQLDKFTLIFHNRIELIPAAGRTGEPMHRSASTTVPPQHKS